jgi:hypothetical protein
MIRVGKEPGALRLLPDGHTLLCTNLGDHTLSVIDLRSRRETARIRLTVTTEDSEGRPTYGYISGLAVDDETGRVWAVSTKGQIFLVDLSARSSKTLFQDPAHRFSSAAWDTRRHRLLVAAEERTIYAYAGGELTHLFDTALPAIMLRREGARLCCVSCDLNESAVGLLDLATGEFVFEHILETGIATDVATGPAGRIWVADAGERRLLELSPRGAILVVRNTDRWLHVVDTDGSRVLVAQCGTPPTPILEYESTHGRFPGLPVREYPVPEEISAILALPGGEVAVALPEANVVRIIGAEEARPFSGFEEEWMVP